MSLLCCFRLTETVFLLLHASNDFFSFVKTYPVTVGSVFCIVLFLFHFDFTSQIPKQPICLLKIYPQNSVTRYLNFIGYWISNFKSRFCGMLCCVNEKLLNNFLLNLLQVATTTSETRCGKAFCKYILVWGENWRHSK